MSRAPWPNKSQEDFPARCAERQADPDLVRALSDDVGDEAVDADDRQHHRDHRESTSPGPRTCRGLASSVSEVLLHAS